MWLSQNIWTLPKYNTYSWGNEPIVNHGSGNFSLLHVSNFVVMCSISFSPNFLHTKKLSLKRILMKIFEKKLKQPFHMIRYLKISDHKNWRFRPLTIAISQLVLSGFFHNYAWSYRIFVTNIEQNEYLLIFEAVKHHDFHSKITLKIFEVCCNSLIDDNMWCSIKNLCPAEVPSSSSRLLWGPKNLHNIFPEKSSAIFESIKL